MEYRGVMVAVFVFWLVSMSWLVSTKIVPMFGPLAPPDQRVFRPEAVDDEEVTCWKIYWNDRPVGWARSTAMRQSVGFGTVQSVVHFDKLPVKEMSNELFGVFASLLKLPSLGLDELSMTATSHMEFDPFGSLQRFRSSLDLDSMGELFRLKGGIVDGKLQLRVMKGNSLLEPGESSSKPLVSREFDLPQDALVADSMIPQSRLAGLQVGQTWRFRAYRAIPPHDPFQVMQATVEREEMFPVEDDVEPVKVVRYLAVGGSGLTTAKQQASSTLWVRDDGTVVQQQMRLGNALIEFMRRPPDDCKKKELP